ncbi:HU family DNA-binding protein [Mycoplasma parvum]|uniref:DNA-binding protein n=1 Tax=Mycoplasma parvum str. Indiana TaxID=1403316 RepID=U5NFL9_9MOLU|nr:HU family DNA-binding protein [Mycoplasma parvum]AGX89033.1 hypothetical protein PRV_01360 [Mycoplasma parvum str. Indiana]
MNKSDILNRISKASGLKREEVEKVLNEYHSASIECIKGDGEFSFFDLGKIKIARRSERKGMNLFTKQPMIIPASNVPKFVASKKLKDIAKIASISAQKVKGDDK